MQNWSESNPFLTFIKLTPEEKEEQSHEVLKGVSFCAPSFCLWILKGCERFSERCPWGLLFLQVNSASLNLSQHSPLEKVQLVSGVIVIIFFLQFSSSNRTRSLAFFTALILIVRRLISFSDIWAIVSSDNLEFFENDSLKLFLQKSEY